MKQSSPRIALLALILALALGMLPGATPHALAAGGGSGAVSLTALGNSFSQDFNTLATTGTANATLPTGWYLNETGSSSRNNGQYAAGTGSDNTGDAYSFGPSGNTDRAFGGLLSGTLNPTVGAQFTNNTGGVITALSISYTGEMWRAGVTNRNAADRLDFQYSTDATSLATGAWIDYNTLDYNSSVINATAGALNGNSAANRTSLSATISGLNIANGASFWIRWTDFDISSSDDGLAVDDFSILPTGVAADAAPTVSSTNPAGNAVDVVLTSDLTVTFSEPVNVSGNWFQIVCPTSGARTVADTAVSGGPTTFTINPNADFVNSETCVVTVYAVGVTDQDGNDPPDNMAADYTFSFTTFGPDNAPGVASTVPADGATNVPLNQNVIVNFTEPVNVTDPWFSLTCATSGAHPGAVTGGPTSFTINPTNDFVYGEQCQLVIDSTKVSDQDSNDPPDTMVVNFTAGFTTEPDPCTLSFTPIPQIQGSGLTAAIVGTVTTQGVVVGDYEYPGSGSTSGFLRGFFLQDVNGDGQAATSDGIFVFNGNNNSVTLGEIVRVTGAVSEFQDQTQIGSVTSLRKCGTGGVTPVDVTFPVPSATHLEQYEGMLVRLPQTMYVTEHFQLGRFGQVVLSADARLKQPTNVVAPGAPALALQAQNNLNKIILDDASQAQNPDPIVFARGGQPLSASNTLRGGDTATGIVGVLNYTWAGNSASGNAYRIRPINALSGAWNFDPANPRPTGSPTVGGAVRVGAMNTLNFFNTFSGCTFGVGGGTTDCRGADNQTEFDRQWPKTVAAILALNPDALGLNEVENDGYGPDSALAFLVSKLNEATAPGTYAFIDADTNTGMINALGTDAIKVGMIYKPAVLTPVGQTAALNTNSFVTGGDNSARNRPSLAQAFKVNATAATFALDVNHLKSKGSACAAPDAGDGQGNCNIVRTNAATELVNWLAADPTGTGETDVLIMGDLNSYAMEDPITAIKNAGYTNLISQFLGPDAYSYVFDGQWGYLDHALASSSILGQVDGVADFHINADEPSVLDYNTDFKTANLITSLYAPDMYRVSDHDPVLVGLTLNDPPTVDAGGPHTVDEGSSVTLTATGADPNGDALTYAWDLDNDGTFETAGQSVSFDAALLDGPASKTVGVKATDPLGLSATATATVDVKNVAPTVSATFGPSPVAVSCGPNNATLSVSFTDPGVADTHSASIIWGDGNTQTVNPATSPFSLPHTYGAAGQYTATATVTDDDGGVGSKNASVTVNYTSSGFLQPINQDGTSVFKYNSTIPVKIKFQNCDGSYPSNLAPTIKVTLMSGSTPVQEINEPVSTSNADTTGVMRFSGDQYMYNLATKPLPDPTGAYKITVTVPGTGQIAEVGFGLR